MDNSTSLKCLSQQQTTSAQQGGRNFKMYICADSGFFLVSCLLWYFKILLFLNVTSVLVIYIMLTLRTAERDKSGIYSCHFIAGCLNKLHYWHNCKPAFFTLLHDNTSLLNIIAKGARVNGSIFCVCFLFARRKKDDNITFDTVCHNPAQELYGLVLEDYNNTKCEMKERKGMGSQFFICSCSEDECNAHIFFTYSKLKHCCFLFCFSAIWGTYSH